MIFFAESSPYDSGDDSKSILLREGLFVFLFVSIGSKLL
jgi:hypothetical protein